MSCSLDSLEYSLCISCNEGYYPIIDDSSNIGDYINCYQSPEGYYLDKNDNYYKPCFSTCKTCDGPGDMKNNNCKTCISNHRFIYDFENDINCYEKCQYNYYFDKDNNYFCTQSLECPEEYHYYISEKDKCIDDCSKDNLYKYTYKNNCYLKCPIRTKNNNYICEDLNCVNYYNFNQTECINEIEEGFFLNNTELKTIDKCHNQCKTCIKKPTENNTNCESCPPDKYLMYGNCISNCPNDFFFDEKDNSIKICKCINSKCHYCSQEALNLNLCDSCNDNYYPIINDSSNNGHYLNCYQSPEGYYLDKNDSYYKPCFSTCKTCDGPGDIKNNNCKTCSEMHIFKDDFPNDNNCYKVCPFYYYFDNDKNYFCTVNLECPIEYNKLISNKSKCIDDCSNDDFYQYEFRKHCINECPSNTQKSETKNNFCDIICTKEKPFEIIEKQECVESKNCTLKDRNLELCITKYKNEKEDMIIQNEVQKEIQEEMKEGNINTTDIDNGNDITVQEDKVIYGFSTTDNQRKNYNKNVTTINLGQCEYNLRKYYNIPNSKPIYIFKIDIIEEGIIPPKIEYEVYYPLNGKNLEKLELNICQNNKVDISIPVKNINKTNMDIYNSSSGFYNDICYTYTSEKKTDLSLNDRKIKFVENNLTLCEENCELTGYDVEIEKVICTCSIKIKLPLISEIKFDKNKFYDSFSNIRNIANLKVMKCYHLLFSKKILNNIGCYIMIPIIIMHFLCIIIFYCKDYNIIKHLIKELIYIKKNWNKLNIKEENISNKKQLKNNKNKIIEKDTSKEDKYEKINKNKKEEKIEKKIKYNIKNSKEKDSNIMNKNLSKKIKEPIFLKYMRKKKLEQKLKTELEKKNDKENKNSPPIKKGNDKRLRNHTLNILKTNGNITNKSKIESSKDNINIPKKEKTETETNNKILKIDLSLIKYTEYELNSLTYKEALISDKRTYIQFYFSLLKTKHLFIFSFYPSKDFNSRIIKIYLFFYSFSIHYTVNALFFNDATMHQIYEDSGDFNIIYQIPQIICSWVISSVLNTFLQSLSLSDKNILQIKQVKIIEQLEKTAREIFKCLYYKFISFFIISFILLLLFWYYISCFCAVYINTQLHLLKDSIISF